MKTTAQQLGELESTEKTAVTSIKNFLMEAAPPSGITTATPIYVVDSADHIYTLLSKAKSGLQEITPYSTILSS